MHNWWESAKGYGALAFGVYKIIHLIWWGAKVKRTVDVIELIDKDELYSFMELAASHELRVPICIINHQVKEDPVRIVLSNGIRLGKGIEE